MRGLRDLFRDDIAWWPADNAHVECDLVVYGCTPGGIAAAVQAKRAGFSVHICGGWRERRPGGLMSGGLGATDNKSNLMFYGLVDEFFIATCAAYGLDRLGTINFEPKVAEAVFRAMLAAEDIPVTWSRGVIGAPKENGFVTKIVTRCGLTFKARQYIDSSYEADLLRVAGVTLSSGRNSRALYGEPDAGRPAGLAQPVSPWRIAGDPTSGLLTGVRAAPTDLGSGDGEIQSFNFRLAMTSEESLMVPLPTSAPAGYDPRLYEVTVRRLNAQPTTINDALRLVQVHPELRNYDVNTKLASTNWRDNSRRYVTPDYDERERVWKDHERYLRGLLWALWGDATNAVSDRMRQGARRYSLNATEFLTHHENDLPYWPDLYVREYAQMVGSRILTQWDVQRSNSDPSGYEDQVVAIASYAIDRHFSMYWPSSNLSNAVLFGDNLGRQIPTSNITPVPWDVMIPREQECKNVSTTWSLSASNIAWQVFRLEPGHMSVGMAAGMGAAIACDGVGNRALQDTGLGAEVRAEMLSQGLPL